MTYFKVYVPVILISIVLLVFGPLLNAVGRFLVIDDPIQHADIIHVISGPEYRTRYGIQLMQEGWADEIFFTGGWCEPLECYIGEYSRELAVYEGVPPDLIAIDDSKISTTFEEVGLLKEYIEDKGKVVKSVIVVTDPFHSRRARWVYRQVFGDEITIIMAPVPFDQAGIPDRWWLNREMAVMVFKEYIKNAYYFVRYEATSGRMQDMIAYFDRFN